MAQTINYADVLERVLHAESALQPALQPIAISALCDRQAGRFMLVATGWENKQRLDSIIFHARLSESKVIIETDQTEEGLTPTLVAAGIRESDIIFAGLPAGHSAELIAA